jgi:hypothetical protein
MDVEFFGNVVVVEGILYRTQLYLVVSGATVDISMAKLLVEVGAPVQESSGEDPLPP